MNELQLAYQASRAFSKSKILTLPATFIATYLAYYWFTNADNISDILAGSANAFFAALAGHILCISATKKLQQVHDIKSTGAAHPFELASEIHITDRKGLAEALESAADNHEYWVTLFHASHRDRIATIDKILSADSLDTSRLIDAEPATIERAGYNGFIEGPKTIQPKWVMASHYNIDSWSRIIPPLNWLQLVAFDTPNGPDVIAYNRQHTYISASHKTKNVLVRATHQDIMNYLATNKQMAI